MMDKESLYGIGPIMVAVAAEKEFQKLPADERRAAIRAIIEAQLADPDWLDD